MPARLILNADDFGLTPGINRAVAELHAAGVLTSATLMATGPAFEDAIAIVHAHPALGVGCHVVLIDGIPVSHPDSIPSLLGADGRSFRPSLLDFLQALARGTISEEEVAREAEAQIKKLQRTRVNVTHLDTHKHLHIFSRITRPLLHAARRSSVDAIRRPFEPPWALALGHGTSMRRLAIRVSNRRGLSFQTQPEIDSGQVLTTDGTLGISTTGALNPRSLGQILEAMPPQGTYELCCHPGYPSPDVDAASTGLRGERSIEREALLSVIPHMLSQPNAPALIHYGELRSV